MSVEKEKNRKKAKELIFEAGYFYAGSPVGQWQGYDIFFAESEKGRHDGPGLLVDGERFRWVEYSDKRQGVAGNWRFIAYVWPTAPFYFFMNFHLLFPLPPWCRGASRTAPTAKRPSIFPLPPARRMRNIKAAGSATPQPQVGQSPRSRKRVLCPGMDRSSYRGTVITGKIFGR